MSIDHHYEHPRVVDITLQRYWEREEQVALAALNIARKNLAGLAFRGQLAFNMSPEDNVVELHPHIPDISA